MWKVSGKGGEGRYPESTVVHELAKGPLAWVRSEPTSPEFIGAVEVHRNYQFDEIFIIRETNH